MVVRSRSLAVALSLPLLIGALAQAAQPSAAEVRARYERADSLRSLYGGKIFNLRITPHWYEQSKKLWFEDELGRGKNEYVAVDTASGARSPLFDSSALASALAKKLNHPCEADALPISLLTVASNGASAEFNADGHGYRLDLASGALTDIDPLTGPRRRGTPPWSQNLWAPQERPSNSPDGKWTAQIENLNVVLKSPDGTTTQVTTDGGVGSYYARLQWRPDSKKLIVWRVTPGDRKTVSFIQSSPPGGGRAVLHTRVYDLPGDKTDHFDIYVIDPQSRESVKVTPEPVDYGDLPEIRWNRDKTRFTYEKLDRGFQRSRIIEVDTDTDTTKNLVDDQAKTFIDSTAGYTYYCDNDEIIWRSERDGWGHLYLTNADGQIENQITKGDWVVRSVVHVDEANRQIVFMASGMNQHEDPYFMHCYRINFDGSGLTALTPDPGEHTVQLSPDNRTLVDTCSTVSNAPVHQLRRVSDGALLATLDKADPTALKTAGWKAPEVFVAKGRDGLTDIWGIVYRPTNLNPSLSYPIIEDIYAGPQDSFVPKDFAPYRGDQALAELGFIVVKVDGMGTRNRSKAFHDVCWKNLADSGFPDRILWMKALARKYLYMDINRVGIFGTSAGGQESTAAMLFHPEFYKVAVSSCGCQDNRMDKLWWNEQWMGYPVGSEYEEQSNITNAGRLRGKLLLMVGEMDTNVPPESTYRLVNALIKSGKDFQFLMIPGSDHTDGGPYGERKRRDFFVHNLLGLEPPEWNAEGSAGAATAASR